MDVIQENVSVEISEWKTLIPLMIDSWVEKKNAEIRSNQLTESCLDHLFTYPSPQIDMMTKFNNFLTEKLLFTMEEYRILELEVNDEKVCLKRLKEEFDSSESSYNGLLLKNNVLFQQIKNFEDQINCTINDEKFIIEKMISENVVLKNEFKHELQNYKLVNEKIKVFQEIINDMSIVENNLAEERKEIMKDLQEIEKTIQVQQKSIVNILIRTFIMLLESIIPLKIF